MIDGRVKMKAEAKSLRFLGESNKLSVPFFQRRYVWDEENWGELVENLENSEVTPFLGSLILKEQSGNEFSVIDGQQRLTALLAAIHGIKVKDKTYHERNIKISFNP